MKITTRFLAQSALIAAVYAALTIILAPISYGQIQIRVSEALTVLPFFTPAAVPGLFIGCLAANFFGGLGPIDIIFGSVTTLAAALLSYYFRRLKWLVPLPPVVLNGLIIGYELHYLYGLDLLLTMLYVALGETIACYVLGFPLLKLLEKQKERIFKQ